MLLEGAASQSLAPVDSGYFADLRQRGRAKVKKVRRK
jgi:hypothetical protein